MSSVYRSSLTIGFSLTKLINLQKNPVDKKLLGYFLSEFEEVDTSSESPVEVTVLYNNTGDDIILGVAKKTVTYQKDQDFMQLDLLSFENEAYSLIPAAINQINQNCKKSGLPLLDINSNSFKFMFFIDSY